MAKSALAKPIKVLLFDDNEDWGRTLQRSANEYRIIIAQHTVLDEAIKDIENGTNRYAGIIVDVCGLRQSKDSETALTHDAAKLQLSKLLPDVPIVGLTGESKAFDQLKEFSEKLYSKTSLDDINVMLKDFVSYYKKSEEFKIIDRHKEVFGFMERGQYLDDDQAEMVSLLREMDVTDKYKENLSRMRRLLEALFIKIAERRPEIIPSIDKYIRSDDGTVICGNVIKHIKKDCYDIVNNLIQSGFLESRKDVKAREFETVIPILGQYADLVYQSGTKGGGHRSDTRPSRYTVPAATFALLDLMLFFDEILFSEHS